MRASQPATEATGGMIRRQPLSEMSSRRESMSENVRLELCGRVELREVEPRQTSDNPSVIVGAGAHAAFRVKLACERRPQGAYLMMPRVSTRRKWTRLPTRR